MQKTSAVSVVLTQLSHYLEQWGNSVLTILVAVTFLAFIPKTSIAQRVRLVPLFSVTGADMDQKFNQPSDVFIDEKHNEFYVVDSGNRRVVVFDMDGFYQYQFAIPGKYGVPSSLEVNNRDEILVVIDGKVACCDFRGSLLEHVEFDGFPDAEKVKVTRLRIDRKNNYYVLDAGKQRVLAFDSDWNFKFAIDKDGLPGVKKKMTPTPLAFHGKEEPMVKSWGISDICVDDDGLIYLVEPMASYVFVFNGKGKYLRSIGEPGAAFNTLSLPNGVTVDSRGRVLVVDTTGHGMLGYDKKGKFLFALGGFGNSTGRFYFPKYISADRAGRIYVVEPFLGRIQVLTVPAEVPF